MLKKLLVLLMFLSPLSCSWNTYQNQPTREIIPRNSFLFVKKALTVYRCTEDTNTCERSNLRSAASAYVVRVVPTGVFAMTAAHVCENDAIPGVDPERMVASYTMVRVDGEEYTGKVLQYDRSIDACMLFVEGAKGLEAIPIADRPPAPGDRVFNVAAPRALFRPGVAPILEGRYSGETDSAAWYTLPAAPGSSGSMIVNAEGELVGMVHSVFMAFPIITLSTRYDHLRAFINNNLNKFSISHHTATLGGLTLQDLERLLGISTPD
jgi:hypothetical protein